MQETNSEASRAAKNERLRSMALPDRVYELGHDAVTAFVLATARHFAELASKQSPGPHAPSGSVPEIL